VRRGKGTLSVVLAEHPKLKNDLLRASMEEIGARTTVFELSGFGNDKKKYLYWLLEQATQRPSWIPCSPKLQRHCYASG
jgi:type II secretory pathway predicted ATPase ExeA